jgi:WhiB family redox-sensing transcriptional regulator
MNATEGMDQFPEPGPLPRQYRVNTIDTRADTGREWMTDAVCAQIGSDAWFPEKGVSPAITPREAKRICNTQCDVRETCLRWALEHGENDGIWGGKSAKERKALRPAQPKLARGGFRHGTRYGYSRGCRNETCPGDPILGRKCVEAERDHARTTQAKRGAA